MMYDASDVRPLAPVEYSITAYSLADDTLRAEFPLTDVDAPWLRAWFDLPESDPVVGILPVGPAQAARLAQQAEIAFDFDHFASFIEPHAVSLAPRTEPTPTRS